MPRAARETDPVFCPTESHLSPTGFITVPVTGSIEEGSDRVWINSLPAAYKDSGGHHKTCMGPNTFIVTEGSATVFIGTTNGDKALAHSGCATTHCGTDFPGHGIGEIQSNCSPDVFVDE